MIILITKYAVHSRGNPQFVMTGCFKDLNVRRQDENRWKKSNDADGDNVALGKI